MSDRQLLEDAAKAAGISGYVHEWVNGPYFICPADPTLPQSMPITYDWLGDDGDALRLAVDLRMQIDIGIDGCRIYMSTSAKPVAGCSYSEVRDLHAAVRLAIVRAAAAISSQNRGVE